MSGKVAPIGGDPRRPDAAKRFPRAAASIEDQLDTTFLISMMLGLAGFMLKLKVMAWASLAVCISGVANHTSATGTHHVATSLVFSVMSVVAAYTHNGPSGLAALFPPPRAAEGAT